MCIVHKGKKKVYIVSFDASAFLLLNNDRYYSPVQVQLKLKEAEMRFFFLQFHKFCLGLHQNQKRYGVPVHLCSS